MLVSEENLVLSNQVIRIKFDIPMMTKRSIKVKM
jgi:hypothetical protein